MKKIFIIAEAGVNHNGDLELAKQLIEKAALAGADAVKFQTFKTEKLVCRDAKKAEYQRRTTDKGESQYAMLKKLELTGLMHLELMEHCKKCGIQFLTTPFDEESLQMVVEYGISPIKVSSGDLTNYPFLKKIAETGKPVILSTGMSTLEEVRESVKLLQKNGSGSITVLHCNTEYPTPMEDVNLRAMLTLKEELGVETGYSDHTLGIEIPIAAAALGATVIEKHFTLDKTMEGPDHKASLEPLELSAMVQAVRNIEKALGNGEKVPSKSEQKNAEVARKSIVAAIDIFAGEVLTEDKLTTKRPGNGISPMDWEKLIGKKVNRDYKADEMIKW